MRPFSLVFVCAMCAILVPCALALGAPRLRERSAGASVAAPIGLLEAVRYRATQLQGGLAASGQGLQTVPSYLTAAGQDITYKPKAGYSQEVLFVDAFQIIRFLGSWGNKPSDGNVTPPSVDYVQGPLGGPYTYNTTKIHAQLEPYLAAGYPPSVITISVDNICWAIAAGGGQVGAWGQVNLPANFSDWADELVHAANDLVAYLGPAAAAQVRWKVGGELNNHESLNDPDPPNGFYALWNTAYNAIRSVIPGAVVLPPEFVAYGGGPVGLAPGEYNYDNADFLAQCAVANTTPTILPKSLNGQMNLDPTSYPAIPIKMMTFAYMNISQPAEIHQFGLLNLPTPPFNETSGDEMGAVSANWEFQTILGIRIAVNPLRITAWATVDGPPTVTPLLNGCGYVRLLLDRYDGSAIYCEQRNRVRPLSETSIKC